MAFRKIVRVADGPVQSVRKIIPRVVAPGVLVRVVQQLRTRGERPEVGEILLVEKMWTAPDGTYSKLICRNTRSKTVWVPPNAVVLNDPHEPGPEWFEVQTSDCSLLIVVWMGPSSSGGAYRLVTIHDNRSHQVPRTVVKLPNEPRKLDMACTVYIQNWYIEKHPELLPRMTLG